ncbi:hypothetical protein K7X08_028643 [Anisodus acutangulus]|uniref:Uncharacterized protein n=1 Tax=Anisodus acutangulus TaxID=402998 RepID=A0A9Q1LXT8_9SOLA|nr:hypothetical protein K7X08_028643 [Anisodus acutangulus]
MEINGRELRFTIREFATVTCLKCTGNLSDFKVAPKENQANGKSIVTSIHFTISDVGINKKNLSGDILRTLTEEIQEGGDLLRELIKSEGFGAQILIEIFQNTSADSSIPSHKGTHALVAGKSDSAPYDAGLSSVPIGVLTVSDEATYCDDFLTSQEMVSYSQFELPDELLPSQVPSTIIVMTLRKERRLGSTQIFPF